jgi:hypothetical protein
VATPAENRRFIEILLGVGNGSKVRVRQHPVSGNKFTKSYDRTDNQTVGLLD